MEKKHIHFIGIKGVGMAPLAIIAKQAGFVVSGCDSGEEFITDSALGKENISAMTGFSPSHLAGVDLVITTGAHGGLENQEVKSAKERNIRVLLQGQAVGEFMVGKLFNRTFKGVSIAGCHGKTTTTAMIATILSISGLDPSYIIGTSSIPSLSNAGHYGLGDFFIAEADEYATEPKFDKTPKFIWQKPAIMVITNIDFDHPDIYKNIDDVFKAYKRFVLNLGNSGVLIINGDDEYCRKIIDNRTKNTLTFGKNTNNNFFFKNVEVNFNKTSFDLYCQKSLLGRFNLLVSGEHNVRNAVSAIIFCLQIGLDKDSIQKGFNAFLGSKRRLEFLGTTKCGARIYDDYAHHPTEIKKTLEGLKKQFPKTEIVCIFQPHTFLRTKIMFDDFVYSFNDADHIIITDIYKSKREADDNSITSAKLVSEIGKSNKDVRYIAYLDDVVKYLNREKFNKYTILVSMGAGDVYKIWKNLL